MLAGAFQLSESESRSANVASNAPGSLRLSLGQGGAVAETGGQDARLRSLESRPSRTPDSLQGVGPAFIDS